MTWSKQIQNKIIQLVELKESIREIKSRGSVVFTNGCFDILHKGHAAYLSKAADLGGLLIVGLNSDASVKRQGKGDDRPINDFGARAFILASLSFVERVVEFDGDTPIELIKIIGPDVLVKGADYDPDEKDPTSKKYIVGRELVLENGGAVKMLDLVPGYSTTNIIKKLQK